MSESTASAAQRALSQNAAVKVVEPQSLSERANQMYETIARRAFELFESEGCPAGRDLEHWLKAEGELLHPVMVTITETEDALTILAEVPGFTPPTCKSEWSPGG